MENVQATSPHPKAAATAAAAAADATTEAVPGAAPTGFQMLLAQQLEGLPALAAALDEDLLVDAAVDSPPGAATDFPMLALLQLVPVPPPPVLAAGSTINAADFDTETGVTETTALSASPRGTAQPPSLDLARATADPLGAAAAMLDASGRASARELVGTGYDAGAGPAQLAFAPNAQPAAPAAAAAPAPAQIQLATPLAHAAWGEDLGQKLVWMANDKQQIAQLHINPPQLGPLEIKLTMDGSDTTAIFTSPHSEVRQAIESALPRLREVLAESGIQLGNASVTADSPRDGSAFSQGRQGFGRSAAGGAETEAEIQPAVRVLRGHGAVDLFA